MEKLSKEGQLSLVQKIATGLEEAVSELLQYIKVLPLCDEAEVALVKLLANQDSRKAVKKILLQYMHKWVLCSKAQIELVKLSANQDCRETVREILLLYGQKDKRGFSTMPFAPEAHIELVKLLTNQDCRETIKEVLLGYVRNDTLVPDALDCLVDLLANPDCRKDAGEILLLYMGKWPLWYKTEVRLARLLRKIGMELVGLTIKELFQLESKDLFRAMVSIDPEKLNNLLQEGLLQAVSKDNYKATWRYATYILHQEMDIKSNGTDVKIVQLIPEYSAAGKFFLHLASVWLEAGVSCEQRKGGRGERRNSVKPLEY